MFVPTNGNKPSSELDYELALDWCRKFDERECALDYLEDLNRVKLLKNLLNIKNNLVGLTELFLTSCFRHVGNSMFSGKLEDYALYTRIIQDWMSLQLTMLQQSKETTGVTEKTAFDYLMEDDDQEEDEDTTATDDDFNTEGAEEETEINFDEEKSDEPPIVNILNMITDVSSLN